MHQVRLLLEFCDCGTLRSVLEQGGYRTADGRVNYLAVLETAQEIASAMLHLHSLNMVHSDLKVGVRVRVCGGGGWRAAGR